VDDHKRNRLLLFLPAAVFPFFFVGGPGYYAARSIKEAWNLGHILFFCLASVAFYTFRFERARQNFSAPVRLFVFVFLVVFLIGVTIEELQTFTGNRIPDPGDILRNQIGVILGSTWFFTRNKSRVVFTGLRALQFSAVLLAACSLWPLARAVMDEHAAAVFFPILSDFETSFQTDRWSRSDQLKRVDRPVRQGAWAMRVQLSIDKYSGASLFYFPRDWSGYRWLHFSVYNPVSETLMLYCRIHDSLHARHGRVYQDRYNTGFVLDSGWNDLRISLEDVRAAPQGREMDMQQIRGFAIFVMNQPRPLAIYLDNVYLGKE
jgi:VanZ family protein